MEDERPASERIPIGALDTPRGDMRIRAFQGGELVVIGGEDGSARKLTSELTILSETEGIISASWINFDGDTISVEAVELEFNSDGLPSAGKLRFDIVQAFNNGEVSVKEGNEDDLGSAVIPDADDEAIILETILWNEEGEAVVTPPPAENAWSTKRFSTKIDANTTGKFAKIWEGALSSANNYSLELSYQEPKAATTPFAGSGQQNLKVSFTCDTALNIIAQTVKIETGIGSAAGEFVLYQIAGGNAALYHKSNQYWGRIQFRVLFQNSEVPLSTFVDNGVYGLAPSFVTQWPSVSSGFQPPAGGTVGQFFGLTGTSPNTYGWLSQVPESLRYGTKNNPSIVTVRGATSGTYTISSCSLKRQKVGNLLFFELEIVFGTTAVTPTGALEVSCPDIFLISSASAYVYGLNVRQAYLPSIEGTWPIIFNQAIIFRELGSTSVLQSPAISSGSVLYLSGYITVYHLPFTT